jgi:hypothetical protein
VIEASHTSLTRDREDKLPIYAEARIPQHVLINLNNNTVEVFSDPDPATREYRGQTVLRGGDELGLRLPGGGGGAFTIRTAEVLP